MFFSLLNRSKRNQIATLKTIKKNQRLTKTWDFSKVLHCDIGPSLWGQLLAICHYYLFLNQKKESIGSNLRFLFENRSWFLLCKSDGEALLLIWRWRRIGSYRSFDGHCYSSYPHGHLLASTSPGLCRVSLALRFNSGRNVPKHPSLYLVYLESLFLGTPFYLGIIFDTVICWAILIFHHKPILRCWFLSFRTCSFQF